MSDFSETKNKPVPVLVDFLFRMVQPLSNNKPNIKRSKRSIK